MAIPVDPVANERYEEEITKAKCIILDGVKDHVVPHIAEKETIKEMWDTLKTLYQQTSVRRKMLLENQLRSYQMQKGEQIDVFIGRLKEIRDQLASIGAMPDQELMNESSGLGREELWVALRQEGIRRLTKVGSSGKGVRIKKEEEEDAAVASVETQEKRKKKDLPKVKCFNCGELGQYANRCPRKKSKGEASNSKVASVRSEKEVEEDDDCAMSAHVPLEKKWGDIEL
eukprot:PITA_14291